VDRVNTHTVTIIGECTEIHIIPKKYIPDIFATKEDFRQYKYDLSEYNVNVQQCMYELSSYKGIVDDIKDNIDTNIPADWNAQDGKAGYIKNRTNGR
jgi:hypothetical protein